MCYAANVISLFYKDYALNLTRTDCLKRLYVTAASGGGNS